MSTKIEAFVNGTIGKQEVLLPGGLVRIDYIDRDLMEPRILAIHCDPEDVLANIFKVPTELRHDLGEDGQYARDFLFKTLREQDPSCSVPSITPHGAEITFEISHQLNHSLN